MLWEGHRFSRAVTAQVTCGLDRVLKNSRFVSGHRFSDAASAAESIRLQPLCGSIGKEVSSSANSLAPEGSILASANL
jgi:hypothetical protein